MKFSIGDSIMHPYHGAGRVVDVERKELTDEEKRDIVERARQLLDRRRTKMHQIARTIAQETGRAVETVRSRRRSNAV